MEDVGARGLVDDQADLLTGDADLPQPASANWDLRGDAGVRPELRDPEDDLARPDIVGAEALAASRPAQIEDGANAVVPGARHGHPLQVAGKRPRARLRFELRLLLRTLRARQNFEGIRGRRGGVLVARDREEECYRDRGTHGELARNA